MYQQQARPNRSGLVLGILIFLAIVTVLTFGGAMVFFAKTITDTLGKVEVSTEAGPEIFPKEWRDDSALDPKAKAINPAEVKRTKALVERELKRYPSPLFILGLHKVYLLDTLEFYGEKYPSGFSGDAIYLTNQGYEQDWLETTLHQEVASMLLHYNPHPFRDDAWGLLLPKDFSYDDGKKRSEITSDPESRERKWLSQGFINEYATIDKSYDFSFIAAGLMTGHYDFHRHLQDHPRLRRKAEFVARYYKTLGITVPTF